MEHKPKPGTVCHFAINVKDTDRALDFYREVFGWSFEAWGPPGFFMVNSGGIMGSIQMQQDEPFPTHIGNFECSIAVEDVDATCAIIVANGGEITMPKVTIPHVADIARVKDSEGNTFSLARYH
jgi:uncharacterized protein